MTPINGYAVQSFWVKVENGVYMKKCIRGIIGSSPIKYGTMDEIRIKISLKMYRSSI